MARTVLITGAGSGIGRGIALAFARRGWRLLLAGRSPAHLQATADEAGPSGVNGVYSVDLADSQARDRLIDAVLREQGVPELLINNAAVLPAGPLTEQTTAEIEAAVALNLLAPAVLTRRFCAATPPPQGVLFILSTAARFPQPFNSLYSATKSGLRALAESLQVELAGKTRVGLVYPPVTATPMTERFDPGRWPIRKADPLAVGERIAAAYEAGRDDIGWFDWESLPSLLYRAAPALFRQLLKSQRRTLQAWFSSSKTGQKP